MLAAYPSQGSDGYSRTYGSFLPRPPETFTAGGFAPFSPILPVPLDQPPPGAQRPQPRRWQFEPGFNLPVGQPGNDGYKLTSFATLKSLSELYSIVRQCIQIRKNEIRGLDWDIVLTKDAAKAYRGDRKAMRDFGERQAKAKKWFKRPDPNYFSFSSWLDALLDQSFVYDALSLYMCPVKGRGMGKGLLGSDLDSLWLIDGSSIRPLAGLHGEIPAPPAPAYQQYEYGVPRADFTQMVGGRDLFENGMDDGDLKSELRGDQMLYLPMLQRPDSPYGFSMVERCLIPVMTGLQKQAFQLDFFRENSIPAVYVSPGDVNMTPNQVRELQDALNAISGDIAWRFKVIVLPPGSKVQPQKDIAIVDQADEWIANEVAMACDITPMELGIIPTVSTVASPFAAREMAQASRSIHQRVSTKPTLKFFTEIFDMVLQTVCGCEDMRFLFSGMEEQQDLAAATDMGIKQIQSGALSIDEFRDKQGLTPWGFPETSGPVVFTPMGPVPLFQGVQNALAAQEQRQQGALTGAHDAAQGATKKPPPKAITAGGNRSGRPGSVTERQAARGGSLAPQHAQGTGAPGTATGKNAQVVDLPAGACHDVGAALPLGENTGASSAQPGGALLHSDRAASAELEALARHLRKGRHVTTWQPRHIPAAVMAGIAEDLTKGLTPDEAATVAAGMLKAAGGQAGTPPKGQQPNQAQQLTIQYTALSAAAFAAAIAAVAALIAAWIAGTLAITAAMLAQMIADEVRARLLAVLTQLWTDAYEAGAQAAGSTAAAADLEAFLATHGEHWADLISGTGGPTLVQAIKDAVTAGDPHSIMDRIAQALQGDQRAERIAVTEVMRAWNAAYLLVIKAAGVSYKTWITMRDGKVCARCKSNEAQGPVPLDAPFVSGDMHPGAHPNCRCRLGAWAEGMPFPGATPPPAVKVLRRQVDTNGQESWAEADEPEEDPAGSGTENLRPHGIDGTQHDIPGGVPGAASGGEPPRWDGSEPSPHGTSPDSGDDSAWGSAEGTGTPGTAFPAPYMDSYWPSGGHGTQQPPASSTGATNGRPPNAVGKSAGALKLLMAAPKAKASTVWHQMRKNYPAKSIAWIKDGMKWAGPVEIPLDLVDFRSVMRWAADHQPATVDHFARELEAGRPVHPAVAVVKPGLDRVQIIDGHHRVLAHKKLGRPACVYVGFLRHDSEAADETHLYQRHQGNDPKND
jgi:hypothetical protein